MKKEACCWCTSLTAGRDSACFCLLGVLIGLYMLVGAAIFSFLERPAELQAHRLWRSRLETFSEEHNISQAELEAILYHYEEARTAGIRAQQGRDLWDFPGAFYFVGTLVSTIGFGVSAPSTVAGKVLLVFYGLLGCSATILFFNLFLERVITFFSMAILWCCRRRPQPRRLQDTNNEDDENNWKPSIPQVTLVLLVAVLLVACCASSIYSVMESWSYLESLYFCFVAFSTVGFGDLVSGQREQHGETRGYQVANCVLMLMGVCCTYSLFNAISVIIKQGLNWLLKCLDVVYNRSREAEGYAQRADVALSTRSHRGL
ncbi:potassium channel subfamily K member 13 [Eucyclogobius newberryi]|uniref:potassium channel subfamily K member 13 n=1 Tax=Eucyclogobius newberryi TaxID=166745 RepID=UPI003B592E0A